MLRTALVVLLVAGVASAADSPLVALAKRTNRKASKTPVITNETVAASKGRLSMAAGDTTASTGTQETSAAVVAGPVSPARLAPQAKADAQPQAPAPAAAAVVDPYRTPTNPASTVRNIEPQSSARNTDPQVTARTIDPSAAPVNANPQSTARTIAPESTARNIQPQQTTSKPPQQ